METITSQRTSIKQLLGEVRDTLVQGFEKYEPTARFQFSPWKHRTGGGGEIALIRGEVFEKAAVNWSTVWGPQFPLKPELGAFFATGVSVITHMYNPNAPTVHMNIRFIQTEKRQWFGGGYDLTPMGARYKEDIAHFHETARQTLEPFGETLYPRFSQTAREYFYIPHRNKERGAGGIFFDEYNSGDFDKDFAMWSEVGKTFLNAIQPIYDRRISAPFTPADKEEQLRLRAHYVEFNLLYDRGTRFGFLSGGNPDAILCSLPPLVKW